MRSLALGRLASPAAPRAAARNSDGGEPDGPDAAATGGVEEGGDASGAEDAPEEPFDEQGPAQARGAGATRASAAPPTSRPPTAAPEAASAALRAALAAASAALTEAETTLGDLAALESAQEPASPRAARLWRFAARLLDLSQGPFALALCVAVAATAHAHAPAPAAGAPPSLAAALFALASPLRLAAAAACASRLARVAWARGEATPAGAAVYALCAAAALAARPGLGAALVAAWAIAHEGQRRIEERVPGGWPFVSPLPPEAPPPLPGASVPDEDFVPEELLDAAKKALVGAAVLGGLHVAAKALTALVRRLLGRAAAATPPSDPATPFPRLLPWLPSLSLLAIGGLVAIEWTAWLDCVSELLIERMEAVAPLDVHEAGSRGAGEPAEGISAAQAFLDATPDDSSAEEDEDEEGAGPGGEEEAPRYLPGSLFATHGGTGPNSPFEGRLSILRRRPARAKTALQLAAPVAGLALIAAFAPSLGLPAAARPAAAAAALAWAAAGAGDAAAGDAGRLAGSKAAPIAGPAWRAPSPVGTPGAVSWRGTAAAACAGAAVGAVAAAVALAGSLGAGWGARGGLAGASLRFVAAAGAAASAIAADRGAAIRARAAALASAACLALASRARALLAALSAALPASRAAALSSAYWAALGASLRASLVRLALLPVTLLLRPFARNALAAGLPLRHLLALPLLGGLAGLLGSTLDSALGATLQRRSVHIELLARAAAAAARGDEADDPTESEMEAIRERCHRFGLGPAAVDLLAQAGVALFAGAMAFFAAAKKARI